MRKNYTKYRLIGVVLVLLMFQSCEKVIDLNIEESSKKIVVNSVVKDDETIVVNITKSKSIIDDNDIEYIDNANIVLTENGNVVNSHTYNGNGNYVFGKIASAGNTYKIKVNVSNLAEANAETVLLVPNNYEIKDTFITNYEGKDYLSIVIKIENTQEQSYFFMEAINENGHGMNLHSYDINAEKNIVGDYLLFNNEISGGGDMDFQFHMPKYTYDYKSRKISNVYFVLHRVSEAYYKYYLSSTMQEQINGSPFAEPVQIYNNIENGFGIFGSESYSVDSLDIK